MTIPTDVAVQLYLTAGWTDITADTRGDINIRRGYADASRTITTSRLTFTLNNRDGKYSPRNPAGAYYGQLQRNTIARVVAGFNTTPTYRSVSSVATGTAGTGTCTKPAGTTAGDILLAFQTCDSGSVDELTTPGGGGTTWRVLAFSDSTSPMKIWWKRAGSAEPASYTFTQNATADGVIIMTAHSGCLGTPVVATTFVSTSSTTVITPSTIPTKSDDCEVRFASGLGNVTWTAPGSLTERADLVSGTYIAATAATRTLASASATGTATFTASGTVSYTRAVTVNLSSRSVRATASISEWPQKWLPGGVDVWVNVEAVGILGRLNSRFSSAPTQSGAYRAMMATAPNLYWPCEDLANANTIASVYATHPAMTIVDTVTLASNTDDVASLALPVVAASANSGFYFQQAGLYAAPTNMQWLVSAVVVVSAEPAGQSNVYSIAVGGTATSWRLYANPGAPGTISLYAWDVFGVFIGSTSLDFTDSAGNELWGQAVCIQLSATQNGANVDFSFTVTSTPDQGTSFTRTFSSSLVGYTIGNIYEYVQRTPAIATTTGHVGVWSTITSAVSPGTMITAYANETAGTRIQRLCDENDITLAVVGDVASTGAMGSQDSDSLMALITQCQDVDLGLLFEPRDGIALGYRTNRSLLSQSAVALSYTTSHLRDVEAIEDNRLLANDVTVQRIDGSSARSTLTTGALSTQDPPNGVGAYPLSPPALNVYADSQLADIAGWLRNIGTWDDPRYVLTIELARSALVANPTLARDIISLDIGDLVTVSSPPLWLPARTIQAIVKGVNETLTPGSLWTLAYNTEPGGPYNVGVYDDATFVRYDSADTTLQNALTAGATSAQFVVAGDTLRTASIWSTADTPYDVGIAGEQCTVTAMTAPAITVVATGAAASGVNASLVPALPAGVTTGDLLLVFAAIRNSGTGTPTAPTGYSTLLSSGNMALFGKIHSGTESAPTVAFAGGTGTDDTQAQMVAFRGAQASVIASSAQLNGSAANIAYPGIAVPRARCVVLYLGWKQDDWTSVATVSGATEIGDLPVTAGNDQGLVWDYVIQTTAADIASGSFTVTGGTNQISRGAVIALAGDVQTATLTRAVNSVSKAQTAGTAVSLFTPMLYGK